MGWCADALSLGMGEESRRLHREYNKLVEAQNNGAKNGADIRRLTDERL